MARGYMSDQVCNHKRKFRFAVRCFYHAGINVDETTRKRGCIHIVRLNHPDRDWKLGIGILRDALGDAVNVALDIRVVDESDVAF